LADHVSPAEDEARQCSPLYGLCLQERSTTDSHSVV